MGGYCTLDLWFQCCLWSGCPLTASETCIAKKMSLVSRSQLKLLYCLTDGVKDVADSCINFKLVHPIISSSTPTAVSPFVRSSTYVSPS